MKRSVWFVLIAAATAWAQPPVPRPGISVQMAATRAATPMAGADQAGALIVAVTRNGQVYLETSPVTLAALTEQLRAARNPQVYVKADTSAPYADVAAVLGALRAAGANTANLLSGQRDPGGAPMGVRVSLSGLANAREKSVLLDAAGPLLFGDVVSIIDASRAAGVTVFLK